MLTRTFCHIAGIGEKKERDLWTAGVICWESALAATSLNLPRKLAAEWEPRLRESQTQLAQRNALHFARTLPSAQHWRLYREFESSCAFVDIETTGLSPQYDQITTIALYDGTSIRHYVNGMNLDQFPDDLARYAVLVTLNGISFDVPFLQAFFRRPFSQPQIDLRYVLKKLGHKGGLKACERQVGVARSGLDDVDGLTAVYLWREYRRTRDPRALETLLAYNIQDVVSLHFLMVYAYNALLSQTPFGRQDVLAVPVPPPAPFRPDQAVLAQVRRQMGVFSPASSVWS